MDDPLIIIRCRVLWRWPLVQAGLENLRPDHTQASIRRPARYPGFRMGVTAVLTGTSTRYPFFSFFSFFFFFFGKGNIS